jgi:uncharacterized protein (TIGR00375 family)
MADQISELHAYTYVTNSDAHSLAKIGREYQEILMEEPSFKEFNYALHNIDGRKIVRNYGMNPQLGKYHRTVCDNCSAYMNPDSTECEQCKSHKVVKGVADRIEELADNQQLLNNRPPYLYQVPLEYLPKLGPKTFNKLLDSFQTEMNIIHHVPYESLVKVVPEPIARSIMQMREGKLSIIAGGGGKYGSVSSS